MSLPIHEHAHQQNTSPAVTGHPPALTGASVGDFGIMCILSYGNGTGINMGFLSGWTLLSSEAYGNFPGFGPGLHFLYKASLQTADINGSLTLQCTDGTSAYWNTTLLSITGAVLNRSVKTTIRDTGSTGTVTTDAIQVDAGDTVVQIGSFMSSATSFSTPAGMTKVEDNQGPFSVTEDFAFSAVDPGANATFQKTYTYTPTGVDRIGALYSITVKSAEVAVDYTVINATASPVTAGDETVDAFTYKNGCAMLAADVATLLGTPGVAVLKNAPSAQLLGIVMKALGIASA